MAYPVRLETAEGGSVLASFPDVPEALTEGATEREALTEAEDCLIAALGGYIEGQRDIPQPSPGRGPSFVTLPALVAAKIALYRAMRERGLGNATMAKRLGTVEGTVRHLLDLDHRSHIGQVEAALHVLGQRLGGGDTGRLGASLQHPPDPSISRKEKRSDNAKTPTR